MVRLLYYYARSSVNYVRSMSSWDLFEVRKKSFLVTNMYTIIGIERASDLLAVRCIRMHLTYLYETNYIPIFYIL